MFERLEVNPKIMCGKPVIKGTRIPVYFILELIAAGYTFEKVVDSYPELKREDILAALNYAASVTKHEETELLKKV